MYDLPAYYEQVVANLTWYQLNSDFKDPMYQYMLKLRNELSLKPLTVPNYNEVDDYNVYVKNATLYYGSYECLTPGKKAFMDSWFSCLLFQIPFFLEKIQLGWIGFVFVIPIMLISIFGGIKESYKWFILNQAIWDAFICYDFICAKPTLLGWSNAYSQQNTCFYRALPSEAGTFYFVIKMGFRIFIRNASFIPVFHLAFSRYICMYFPSFYKRFTKNGYKIFVSIIIFNILCLTAFCARHATILISVYSVVDEALKCNAFCSPPLNSSYCTQNVREYFQCTNRISIQYIINSQAQQRLEKIFQYISYSTPPIMFALSIVCAGFLFYKIASQLKFQLKNNRESFKQTIKISSVVGFQCLTMSVIFVVTGIQKYMQIKSQIGDTKNIYNDLPTWIFLLQYYTTTASLNMIRIILDSCVVLIVLSGYSHCVVLAFKVLWLFFTNPRKAIKKIKYNITGSTEVKVLSTAR